MAVKLNANDLKFILDQIKIAEAHAGGADLADLIPDPHVPWGLRTVDGTYNNIVEGRETWGAAHQPMPRLFEPHWNNEQDGDEMPFGPPGSPVVTNTDYGVVGTPVANPFNNGGHTGNVADADPRIISNLVVDMSINNPAAVAAWLANDFAQAAFHEKYGEDAVPLFPGSDPATPNGVFVTNEDLANIPNIAPDEGLSAPFNAWMTFFGQFFDHGLDLISKGGNGTIYIPLQPDDPLITHGPDGIPDSGDEVDPSQAFMVLTRSAPGAGPGPDGVLGTADDTDHEGQNVTTPFVDQNQTYTSHASHQVFLREYAMVDGRPLATGRLLNGASGEGLATWADVKLQARDVLGIDLTDEAVTHVPLLLTDPYGEFIRGPNGFPMLVLDIGDDGIPNTADDIAIEGNPLDPIDPNSPITHNGITYPGSVSIANAFLDDIAHNAVPVVVGGELVADADSDTGNAVLNNGRGTNFEYDNELLDRHFITGDGRGNENIGLTAVHHIFHSEHNRLVDQNKRVILETGELDFINQWLLPDSQLTEADLASIPTGDPLALNDFAAGLGWDGERIFQSARFGTEMQYQHLVFEEFGRKVQPLIDVFVFNSITDVNPAIFAEFANVVYRFGHSMLTENVARIDPETGEANNIGLIEAFLNPVEYTNANGEAVTSDDAAASFVLGMTREQGNEIDEFVTGALRNNLLGLPLDLASINIARGRDTGMPTLNEARAQLYAASSSTFLKPYDNWVDFAANLKNPMSVINFIAAYGTHSSITDRVPAPTATDPAATREQTLAEKRAAATLLVMGSMDVDGDGDIDAAPADRMAFLTSTGAWADEESGLNRVDLWIGGLAEKKMPFGGMLGSTFNAVFELQMENLQDGDRFYYLTRTQGQNFLNELEQNSFSKMILANTGLSQPGPDGIRGTEDDIVQRHIGVDSFAKYDHILEIDTTQQDEEDPSEQDPVLAGLGLAKVQRDNLLTADVDESNAPFYNFVTAMLKAYGPDGQPTGGVLDGSADGVGTAADPVTWADFKANAARFGIELSDEDVLDTPVLRVDGYGNPMFTPQATDTVDPLVNGSFEALALVAGTPGVFEDARGNYNFGSPEGWSLVGTGGLFAPIDSISDTDGHTGANVAWLSGGATLSQDTGHSLVAGVSYTVDFNLGDRTDFAWPGGTVRLLATNGITTVEILSLTLPEPADGLWTPVNLLTGPIGAALAGYSLVIEFTNTGGGQYLVDDVAFAAVPPVVYSSDQNVADIAGYNAANDPFVRDASGDVLRSGTPLIEGLPANATPGDPTFDPAALADAVIDVQALSDAAKLAGNYIRYTGGEHIVVGGTNDDDIIITDFGDDAIWGDAGNDRIESGAGVDLVNGGAGDDIITDSGDTGDFLKGEGGNDVIANSNGLDILMGGTGKDAIFVGVDMTEVFGGEGDDFILGGDDMDFLLGNEGDDWIEAGGGFDTTAGDNSELFFDSKIIGHDVMFAGNDEHDFDAESGDDIMVQGESVMRNEGMFGFDWVSFQGMQLDAYADMRIRIFTTEQEDILRNRFDKVEALSGWDRDDTLLGDERTAPDLAGEVEIGDTVGANENVLFNDGLSQAGVDRIHGLREFLGELIEAAPNGATAAELEELIAFEAGNIILGGGGNDRIAGNGGNDILDGDRYLQVRIAIRDDAGNELDTVFSLKHVFEDGPWAGRSLFELLLDRTINPAQLHIVREILGHEDDGFDTAVYRGSLSEYVIEGFDPTGPLAFRDLDGDGFIKITHLDPTEADGVTLGFDGEDHISNFERLEFADAVVNLVPGSNALPQGTIEISDPRPSIGSILTAVPVGLTDADSISPTNPTGAIAQSQLEVVWQAETEFQSGEFVDVATGSTLTVTAAMLGLQIRAIARFRDGDGVLESVMSAPTEIVANDVTPVGTNGADLLIGRNGADIIDGLAGDDEIFGLGGADVIAGGAGNDIIDGGRGNDTAVFNGNLADFTFEFDELANLEVVETATGEEDLVLNIENFQFNDQTITLAQAQSLAGIIGTDGPDTLTGTADDDFIFGRGSGDTLSGAGGDDVIFGEGGGDTLNGDGGIDTLNGGNGGDTLNGGNGADILNGDGGNDTLNGDNGADTLTGGVGDDIVNGGAGNDTVIWNVGDGHDIVDGGANGGPGDTMIINGDNSSEAFTVFARADWDALPGNDGALLDPATEIVVTRNGTGFGSIIAELANIEEIIINTSGGLDTVNVAGNFAPTQLSESTITINGSSGDDTVDISALTSAHRIVFKSLGGNDTIIGTLRPQDVIELPAGASLASFTETETNGMKTFSNGTHSISFPSSGTPQFVDAGGSAGSGGASGEFHLTASDLAGLKALVNGDPLPGEDDDVPTGVRTLSGDGNNEDNPTWGAAGEPFIRLTTARYGEADAEGNRAINPIFDGLNARTISDILGAQEADLPKAPNDANIFFMAFGQYFDHGLDFLPKGGNGSIVIGAPGGGHPGSNNPADLTRGTVVGYDENGVPQHTNLVSPFVDQNQAYGSHELVGQFLRQGDGNGGLSSYLLRGAEDPSAPGHTLLPTLRELIEHHWENNTIFNLPSGPISFREYFTDYEIEPGTTGTLFNQETRAFDPGVLNKVVSNFMGSGQPLLIDVNPFIDVLDHYVAGDGRANENYALTSMHTIWARNHNYHVENLVEYGFEGTEEQLFQAAKMINEAEYQRVVFDEFADALIGGMRGSGSHGHDEYNPDATAGISHEFAAAVYRVGHSLIGQTMTVLDENGQPKQVALFDAFLNPTNDPDAFPAPPPPGYTPQPGYAQYGVDSILGGIVTQPAEGVDFNIVDAVRNDLVRISADLFAFNVARGWDVGLGTLNQVRKDLAASNDPYIKEALSHAGDMSAYSSWEDFQARNGLSDTVIEQFKQAYPDLILAADDVAAFQAVNPDITLIDEGDGSKRVKGIDRVDLWVGGLAEKHINGGMVGQTFWIVLHEQFDRLQEADRFYYTDRFDNFDFYEEFVDGQNFADIVERNSGLMGLPEDIFAVDDEDDEDSEGDDDDDTDEDDDDDTTSDDDDEDDDDTDQDDDEEDEDDDSDSDEDDDEDDSDSDDDDDDEDGDADGGITVPIGQVVPGTAQADILVGTSGDDIILGLEGDDSLIGLGGSDTLRAGEGDDFLSGGADDDVLLANGGNDELFGGLGNDMLIAGAGDDLLNGDEGDDVLEGGLGSDTAFGGDGDDLFLATVGDGSDIYWGGSGADTIDYAALTESLQIDLGSGLMGRGIVAFAGGSDTIYGMENVIGGQGDDIITANDIMNVLDGGEGSDIFRFLTTMAADGDTVMNFQAGDKIDLAAIDARTGTAGNQAFQLVSGNAFTAVGQVKVDHVTREDGDYTIVSGNVNDDLDADFELAIKGIHDLNASSLIS